MPSVRTDDFLPTKYQKSASTLHRELNGTPASHFIKKGEVQALRLFREMAKRVPAYKNFLKKNKIDPARITNIVDFASVPLLDKDNYLRRYPIEKLCWNGMLKEKQWTIAATSGSTGQPFYFPRQAVQDRQYGITAELYLRNNFEIHKRSTLYLNCFALGVWIGGIFTHDALRVVAERGDYALSVINPGLNKAEIIKAVRSLGPHYDQVIVGGYPPFVKDVLDDGTAAGLDWKKYHMKFVFSAEGFSEDFRDYIARAAGVTDIYRGTLNHYGTVDQGTIAHETPLAILVRRLALKNPKIFEAIFPRGARHLPTLAQYDPELFYFEEVRGGLVCSSYSGLPLVRYDLKDYGGVIGFDEMVDRFRDAGIDLRAEIRRHGLAHTVWHLPFVYVYERKDFSISISGANIYPENVRNVLQSTKFAKYITGKFTMIARPDKKQDQEFVINIELKNGVQRCPSRIAKEMTRTIAERLLDENSEYRIIYEQKRKGAIPHLVFWKYETPEYFRIGGKQKWTLKKA